MPVNQEGSLKGRVHFVGIGGVGMSGIAAILIKQGFAVSGSDVKNSQATGKLALGGAKIFLGHAASNVDDADVVVYSSAIKTDNPELLAARDRGIRVIRRAEALAQLMRGKTCIAVSGAHGKTTTTALISHLLLHANFNPTVAIGGILRNLQDNACLGESNFFVAEADESDGTFLCYEPDYPVVLNIDREHLDYYKDWAHIVSIYGEFISNTKDGGCLFCCGDDPAIRQITKGFKKRAVYFGLSQDNDFYPDNITLNEFSSDFSCNRAEKSIGRIKLPLAGSHNISNSLAAVAVGIELGMDFKTIEGALATFKGTARRFELKADIGGIRIIDDYGHHPSEIKATLRAAENVKHGRLVVVFQPHRYSRTKFLMGDLAQSLAFVDYLLLTDIYPASESSIPGVSSETLCARIREINPKINAVCLKREKVLNYLKRIIRPGDLVLTLGAGDIGKISDELVQWVKS